MDQSTIARIGAGISRQNLAIALGVIGLLVLTSVLGVLLHEDSTIL